MKIVLIVAIVAVALVTVLALLMPGGPRITTIERRREDEKDSDDA